MDAAWSFWAASWTCPPRVTTPLSRSWRVVTSFRPACRSDVRMPAETSADFVEISEHPARIPSASSGTSVTHCLSSVITFSPLRGVRITMSSRSDVGQLYGHVISNALHSVDITEQFGNLVPSLFRPGFTGQRDNAVGG